MNTSLHIPDRAPPSLERNHKKFQLPNWKAAGQHKSQERRVSLREAGVRHYHSPKKMREASVLDKTLDNTEMNFKMDEPTIIHGSVFAQKTLHERNAINVFKKNRVNKKRGMTPEML